MEHLPATIGSLASIFVPFFFFLFLATVIILPVWIRSQDRRKAVETLKALAEKGAPIPAELTSILHQERGPPNPDRELRAGLILIAVSIAIAAVGVLEYVTGSEQRIDGDILGGALFPGLIGLVLVGMWAKNRRRRLDD